MNVDLAYLIGVYLSDGSAHQSYGNWIVSLTVKDEDFAEEFAGVLSRISGQPVGWYTDGDMWKVSYYSKEMVLYLWDVTNHKAKIPESIALNDIPIKLSFLAGFLDGDGYITKHKSKDQYQIGFVGVDDWVKDTLPGFLLGLGMKPGKVNTSWPKTQFKANRPIHRVLVNVHSFVAAGGFARMKRKNDRILEYYELHQSEFTDAEKQRRYKRIKSILPSETTGFYGNA